MIKPLHHIAAVVVACGVCASASVASPAIKASVVNGTGTLHAAAGIRVTGNIGQPEASARVTNLGVSVKGGFIAAPACVADFNANGFVDIDDIFIYLNAWFAQNLATDMNGNGVDIDDIFIYLNRWFAGC